MSKVRIEEDGAIAECVRGWWRAGGQIVGRPTTRHVRPLRRAWAVRDELSCYGLRGGILNLNSGGQRRGVQFGVTTQKQKLRLLNLLVNQ